MSRGAFYNEHDPHAAAWLRRLIKAGHIAPGVVDSRSILALKPSDLDGFTQVHFFAGIGGWSYALRLAGWPDDRPVWTGSCPCQPFSSAGKGQGLEDDRHLWPVFFDLIREHRPHAIFGEQVSSPNGLEWFDVVSSDLEGAGYAVGALDTCAASVGAPHRRQRLYFRGHTDGGATREHADVVPGDEGQHGERATLRRDGLEHPSPARRVGYSDGEREGSKPGASRGADPELGRGLGAIIVADSPRERSNRGEASTEPNGGASAEECGSLERLADSNANGCELQRTAWVHGQGASGDDTTRRGPLQPWASFDWVLCNDPSGSRWRPIEPGTFPLADGVPEFVGRLRGYGNAIVPQLAAEFVSASMEALGLKADPIT